jgi:hypothetical protein
MKITNKHNLPEAIVNAVRNDKYVRSTDPKHFSCTGLLRPSRQRALEKQYGDEIEEDASDRIWALFGQAVHVVCERGNVSDLVETRFSSKFDEYTVSAQIDSLGLKDGVLTDYKTTSVYKIKNSKEGDADWTAQLNIQAELLRRNGHIVKKLQIVALLRDHSRSQAARDFNYPDTPVVVVPIAMWTEEKTVAFITARIKSHMSAEIELPFCSKEERWASDPVYAVMKHGRKTAVKLFDNESEAKSMIGDSKEMYLQVRPGESRRCADYCSVAKFCSQFKKEQSGD